MKLRTTIYLALILFEGCSGRANPVASQATPEDDGSMQLNSTTSEIVPEKDHGIQGQSDLPTVQTQSNEKSDHVGNIDQLDSVSDSARTLYVSPSARKVEKHQTNESDGVLATVPSNSPVPSDAQVSTSR
jgi:hypothetical protein